MEAGECTVCGSGGQYVELTRLGVCVVSLLGAITVVMFVAMAMVGWHWVAPDGGGARA
jgi:hypothetical protein